MQCVVLAGGLATRMLPATRETPKWLLPVAGRPFADWQLEWLAAQGVDRVVVAAGHLADEIVAHVGDGRRFGLEVGYSLDGPTLLGTAGALRIAADRGLLDDRFLVLYGDSHLTVDLSAALDAHAASGCPALMVVYRNADRYDASNVEVGDGLVVRYRKRPVGSAREEGLDWIDYGVSVLTAPVVEALPAGAVVDLSAVLAALAAGRDLAAFEVHDRFYEIGSPEGLRELEAHLAAGGRAHR